ncbi:MAG: hypothetical protein R3A46_09545 [Thermomicrobiales bacterium]
MAGEEERNELVVNFDYYGNSIVLAEDEDDDHAPGAHPGEARVEVDPLVEAFARSPYDPVIGAMMMGRATGEVIARPPGMRWMRVVSWLLGIGLVAQFPLWLIFSPGWDLGVFPAFTLASSGFVASFLFGIGGMVLLYRLSTGSGGD